MRFCLSARLNLIKATGLFCITPVAVAYLKMPLKRVRNSSYLRGWTFFIIASKSTARISVIGGGKELTIINVCEGNSV
jgi:hypothetical protein